MFMILLPGIRAIDLALYIEPHKTLVICDLHIGYEENLALEGVLVPKVHVDEVISRLKYVFSQVSPATIIVNGDLKHEFGSINRQEWRKEGILVTHGDKVPQKLEKTLIIGHEHPAVSLKEASKIEKYKCFLLGKFKGSQLIVQPSFNLLVQGTDVTRNRTISPFIEKIDDFSAYLVDDSTHEVLEFGNVGSLK